MKLLPIPLFFLPLACLSLANDIQFSFENGIISLSPVGDEESEWLFEFSKDLENWEQLYESSPVFPGENFTASLNLSGSDPSGFFRAVKTEGFYDPSCLRTIELTFEDADWLSQLAANYSTGEEMPGVLQFRDETVQGVGVRYKGNTSYRRANGEKKSLNLSVDAGAEDADLEGYETLNLNNAAGDQTLLKEGLYFNAMRKYTACPGSGFVQLNINGENWGVYSNVQQQDSTLMQEYFDDNDGDRWKSPSGPGSGPGNNAGPGGGRPPPGGGGGWASGNRALLYLGDDPATYESLYELKKQNTDDPWANLMHATDVLNNTPRAEFKDKVGEVLAVDSWLWFLVLENVFTDDDSYWHKGCDYMIYFEPESGRIFPVQHDGNEAFTSRDVRLDPFEQEHNANRPVISKLLAVPEFRQRYIAHMRTVIEEDFKPEILNATIDHYVKVIESAIEEDPKKDFTIPQFRSGITALKDSIQTRYEYLISHAEISQAPPAITSVALPFPATSNNQTPVTAAVTGSAGEGVDAVFAYYTPEGRIDPYERLEMFDDGNHNDLETNDGVYGASLPGFPAGEKVWYYVEARSANASNTTVFHPAKAEVSPLSYRVESVTSDLQSPVIINELMASNETTITDPQGEFDDWIELHNITESQVDLSGWYLSDNPDNPRKWEFPANSVIEANDYLIIWADEDGSAPVGLHASFKLSGDGEFLSLALPDDQDNHIMDQVEFGPQEQDISLGRVSSEEPVYENQVASPGEPNL